MSQKPGLRTIRSTFDQKIESSAALFSAVHKIAVGTWDAIQGWEDLYPGQARRIAALAFLQIVICWEDFVEGCFVRYLMGASAPSGYRPKLRLAPAGSISHAYQLASGDPSFRVGNHYIMWAPWRGVVDRGNVFFDKASPFSSLSLLQRDRLSDATKIRNRIAHASAKVRGEFVQVAKRHLGLSAHQPLAQGYDVGRLLIDTSGKGFGPKAEKVTYFEHYLNLFLDMAEIICPWGPDGADA